VVVDAMRFPFIEGGGTGTVGSAGNPDTATMGQNVMYSWQRMQPYRGGHAIPSAFDPNLASPGGPTIIDSRYGFTEQMAVPKTKFGNTYGIFGNGTNKQITQTVFHTLTKANDNAQGGAGTKDPWDYFPFHDRDFTSLYELTLVPGCPPGLFTKQFVENVPGNVAQWPRYGLRTSKTPAFAVGATPPNQPFPNSPQNSGGAGPSTPPYESSDPIPTQTPQSYPYLVDEFFYTAAESHQYGLWRRQRSELESEQHRDSTPEGGRARRRRLVQDVRVPRGTEPRQRRHR